MKKILKFDAKEDKDNLIVLTYVEEQLIDIQDMENKELTLNEYQEKAMTTCLPSSANDMYMVLGLVEEVGELIGKISKAIRKEQVMINENTIQRIIGDSGKIDELRESIMSEISDCYWFLAGICTQFGWKSEDVCKYNLDKLAARKQQNTIITHKDH